MKDQSAPALRERVWITKFDHSVDPPRAVQEVFIENGVVVSATDNPQQEEAGDEGREGAVKAQ